MTCNHRQLWGLASLSAVLAAVSWCNHRDSLALDQGAQHQPLPVHHRIAQQRPVPPLHP